MLILALKHFAKGVNTAAFDRTDGALLSQFSGKVLIGAFAEKWNRVSSHFTDGLLKICHLHSASNQNVSGLLATTWLPNRADGRLQKKIIHEK